MSQQINSQLEQHDLEPTNEGKETSKKQKNNFFLKSIKTQAQFSKKKNNKKRKTNLKKKMFFFSHRKTDKSNFQSDQCF